MTVIAGLISQSSPHTPHHHHLTNTKAHFITCPLALLKYSRNVRKLNKNTNFKAHLACTFTRQVPEATLITGTWPPHALCSARRRLGCKFLPTRELEVKRSKQRQGRESNQLGNEGQRKDGGDL